MFCVVAIINIFIYILKLVHILPSLYQILILKNKFTEMLF